MEAKNVKKTSKKALKTKKEDHGSAKFKKCHHEPFLEWIRNGGTIRGFAREHNMNHGCIVHFLMKEKNEGFRNQYRKAFDDGLLVDIDQMRDIAKDGSKDFEVVYNEDGKPVKAVLRNEYIQRSKLICETIQWQAARRFPRDYGNKVVDDEGKSVKAIPLTITFADGQ